jgi:hypothetical protein
MKLIDKKSDIINYIDNHIPESLKLNEVWGNKIWFKTGKKIENKDLFIIVQKSKSNFNYYNYVHSWFYEDITYYFTKEESYFFYKLIEFLEELTGGKK